MIARGVNVKPFKRFRFSGRTGLSQTIGDACRQQGRAVLQQLLMFVHDQWSHGTKVAQVLTQLFAKQQGIVPV